MSLSAAALRKMRDFGLSADQMVELAETLEDAPQTVETAADRKRARDRDRMKEKRDAERVARQSRDVARDTSDPFLSPEPPNLSEEPTPLSPPTGDSSPRPSATPLAKPSGFARFWEAYPNKTAKRRAETAWAKAEKRCVGELLALCLPAIERAKRGRQWREGFIPHPATWLNDDGWLDGVETAGPEPPAGPITAAELARRHRHFADTGEWPAHWGEPPKKAA